MLWKEEDSMTELFMCVMDSVFMSVCGTDVPDK